MATHVLSLQLGSTNISLVASNVTLLDYAPQSASPRAQGYGQEIYAIESGTVTETVRVLLTGSTGADVQSTIASIERMIEDIHRRQRTRTGNRGYLYLRLGSDSETWRSEILYARLQADDNALRHLNIPAVEALLFITRRPFWETVTEREIPLDNGSAGGKATGGVTIYNHDDGDANHDNWVDVAAVDVAGNLPAPLRITMTNSSGVNLSTRKIYIANNYGTTPSSFVHMVEGEAAASISIQTAFGNQGGNFGRASWTGASTHATNRFVWTLGAAQLALMGGGFYRVVCRFANTPPTNIEVQLHTKFSAALPLTTFWSGPRMTMSSDLLQDLGVVQLPPGVPSTSADDIGFVLTVSFPSTSQLDIDFIQLTPAESTRNIQQISDPIPNGDVIVCDGPEKRNYIIETSSGYQWNIFSAQENVVYAWPNRAQRLIFLHDEATTMNIARTWSVRAYYRPRRSTL